MTDKSPSLRVCLVAPLPPPYGGVANWTRLVIDHAARDRRVEFHVINTSTSKRSADGRGWFDRILMQGLRMVRGARQLHHLLEDHAVDVVHLTTAGQLGLIRDLLFMTIARRQRVPVAYHLHFGRLPELARQQGVEWRFLARSLRRAAVVIALDHSTAEAIRSALPGVHVVRVPNPVALETLPDPTGGTSRRIVFLGWVTPTKGIEDLLVAWPGFHEEHADWDLQIIGPYEPGYLDSLYSRFEMAGVTFTGEVPHEDALKSLAQAGILVLPSHTEAFPYAVLEAMALARPVVATRVGAIPEILADGCGVLIDPHDPHGLARELKALARDPVQRSELGRRGRERISRDFRIDGVFASYLGVWTALNRAEVRT